MLIQLYFQTNSSLFASELLLFITKNHSKFINLIGIIYNNWLLIFESVVCYSYKLKNNKVEIVDK